MKLFSSLAVVLAACISLPAQSTYSGQVTNSNFGATIWFSSKLEPSTPESKIRGSSVVTHLENARPGMRRFETDLQTHEYFGYDLNVESIDKTKGTLRITFNELPANAKSLELKDWTEWHRAPLPVFPPPQTISIDDKLAVTLFEDPVSHQKVVDYIHFTRDPCDANNPGPGQVECLASQLEEAKKTLSQRLSQSELQNIRDSQRAWESYFKATCANITSEPNRLGCELRLTRSRLHDLELSPEVFHQ